MFLVGVKYGLIRQAAMMNIFSYAQMVDLHPVTYDSTKEDAFIVHLPHKQVKFMQENGLYVYRPPYVKQPTITNDTKVACDNKLQTARAHTSARNMVKYDNKVQFLETVDENKKFYTNINSSELSEPANYFTLLDIRPSTT
jgi:hypothetical protein